MSVSMPCRLLLAWGPSLAGGCREGRGMENPVDAPGAGHRDLARTALPVLDADPRLLAVVGRQGSIGGPVTDRRPHVAGHPHHRVAPAIGTREGPPVPDRVLAVAHAHVGKGVVADDVVAVDGDPRR